VDSAPVVGTEVVAQCPEREKLLREYTQCGHRLAHLLDEQLAAMKRRAPTTLDRFVALKQ
jgi:hypothetical protein